MLISEERSKNLKSRKSKPRSKMNSKDSVSKLDWLKELNAHLLSLVMQLSWLKERNNLFAKLVRKMLSSNGFMLNKRSRFCLMLPINLYWLSRSLSLS